MIWGFGGRSSKSHGEIPGRPSSSDNMVPEGFDWTPNADKPATPEQQPIRAVTPGSRFEEDSTRAGLRGSPDRVTDLEASELQGRIDNLLYRVNSIVDKTLAMEQMIKALEDMRDGGRQMDKGQVKLWEVEMDDLEKIYGDVRKAA